LKPSRRTAGTALLAAIAPLTALAALAAITLTACQSVTPAHMATPPELSASNAERIELKGLAGLASGRFESSAGNGRFERSADRISLFNDVAMLDRAYARFDLHGAGTPVTGECRMERNSASVGTANLSFSQPLVYHCAFTLSPGGAASQLVLREDSRDTGLQTARRAGAVDDGATRLDIESVESLQGGSLRLAAPVGYVFRLGGRAIGGVDLAGAPTLLVSADVTAEARHAIVLAGLSLALLWDPAPH
jgi:hypothetical protein